MPAHIQFSSSVGTDTKGQHSTTHLPQQFSCWGCGGERRFAPTSAMKIHLENGGCSAGWKIQHLNAIAAQCPDFAKNLIQERLPWFRAGAPRKFAFARDRDRQGIWSCYLCHLSWADETVLTSHLQISHSDDYPPVICCPCCDAEFTLISGLFQHIETPRCSANYKQKSIEALMSDLKSEVGDAWSDFRKPEVQYTLE